MKKLKIEIQVTILTIGIAVAVIVSGYLAYQSLSRIVDAIHKAARPDLKLILIKDIASDLNEVENTIRLYSLTGNATFIKPYQQLNSVIQEKLSNLQEYAVPGSDEIQQIDSIRLLVSRKLLIWDEIRALHRSKANPHKSFSELFSKLDTVLVVADTITIKPEVKKGFFKRLFSKKDTARRSIIIDKTKEKETIRQEIAGAEKNITDQAKRLQAKDKILLEKNIEVTKILDQQIVRIENSEQKRLEAKTREADSMAGQAYQRMAIFTVAAVILLIVVLTLFFRNLQKNRTYQQVLRKAKAEAESLAKAKEMFVATVSHEMRTPVNAIYGLTEQMLQKSDSAEISADLEVVHKSAEHLIALVNDTLDFSKIESQKLKIEQIDFLPDEILSEVHTLHKDSAKKKGIELIFRNNTEKNLVLRGDPIRLKQILINLITNAIKFTNQGQITLTASAEETPEQNYLLHLEVSDTGVGISKENLSQIFDEFVQLDTDLTRKQRGAGLGLAIVKKLVALQNGQIEVNSTLGKGTSFSLQIPYKKGDPDGVKKQSVKLLQIPSWFQKLHFLIVDDEEFNLYLIRNILKTWGVSFTVAHNGQEAVELADKNWYDLIFMDIRMPVMDGYEATKQILQHRSSFKIIALTATAKTSDIQKIEQAGMCAFLQKPFAEADLLNTILKLLPEKVAGSLQEEITQETVIDLEELERISGGDDAFLREMLSIFIRSGEEALAKFQQNLKNSNWSELAETAHKLAAPAKHLQATTLYNQLKKLENTAESSTPEEMKNLIAQIDLEINRINSILKQKIEKG